MDKSFCSATEQNKKSVWLTVKSGGQTLFCGQKPAPTFVPTGGQIVGEGHGKN